MNIHTMRKSFPRLTAIVLVVTLVVSGLPLTVYAGDTWPFKEESAHGQNQPNVHGYTSGQIMEWSPETDPDAEKLRAHIPLQNRIDAFTATQANPNLSPDVKMTNVSGDYGNAFIENAAYTNKFAQYHFNFWQYVDYYSPWHGTATAYTPADYYDDLAQKDWQQKWFEFGMLNIPNPTYTDAAHKNGVLSLAGIFFSNNDRGQQTYKQMIVKDENGNFPVAEKMVEMANYFGYDGYFINQEEVSPNVAVGDIPDYIAFMKALQKSGLYVQWYDSLSIANGANTFARTFNDNNISFLYDKNTGEKVSQSFFFDYGVGSTQINSAKTYINNLNTTYGTNYNIYDIGFAGLEGGRDRFKQANGTAINKLLSNGVPQLSVATLGADFVHAGLDEDMNKSWPISNRSDNDYQWMTNLRDQLWWSGPNVNPANVSVSATNTVSDVYADNRYWPGIASVITERSVVGDSNFYTNFNTGHGLSYYVNGTESSTSEWSNMSLQDIPVTWQWWQETAGKQLTVDFDYGSKYSIADTARYNYEQIGGFNGGSSLVVNGELDAENFLRLYKTDLQVNGNSKLSISYNKPSVDDQSNMSIGLVFEDNPTEVVKLPIADNGNKTAGWLTKEVELGQYDGKSIAAFGLVLDPGQDKVANYQMNIGQIRVYDGSAVKPSAPTGLGITEAFTDTNEMNIKWNMDTDYSKVKQYNVYVNDIFVGGKYDEVFYIKNLPAQSGVLKVVPVGADGLEGDAATLSFDLTAAVSNISVNSEENGDFTVSWSNGQAASGDIKVEVRSVNKITTPVPVSEEVVVPAGSGTATFTGMPANGDDYIVTISSGNTNSVSMSGNFIDKIVEPYAEAWSWDGDTLNLPMPNTRDWRYLYVYEDGKPKSFATTYSSGNFEKIFRGRTTKASLSFKSTASNVHVVMEDYAGNLSEQVDLVKSYNISFDSDGGAPVPAVIKAIAGAKIEEPTGVVKDGYVLEGWYNNNVKWNFAEDTVTGGMTLKAQWVEKATDAPTISILEDGTFRAGTTANLTTVVTGTGELTYAWYLDDGSGYGDSLGTESSYTIPVVDENMNGYKYKVVVTNETGLTGESEISLNILPADTEWVAPDFVTDLEASKTVNEGEEVNLFIVTSGDVESITWEVKSQDEETWSAQTVTSAVYTFTATSKDNGKGFRVVLQGKEGVEPATRTSTEMTLTVTPKADLSEWNRLSGLLTGIDALVNNDQYTAKSIADLKAHNAYTEAKSLTPDSSIELIKQAYVNLVNAKQEILVVFVPVTPPDSGSDTDTGSGSGSASVETPAPTPVPVPSNPNKVVVSAGELRKLSDNGVVVISVGSEVTELELPADTGNLLGENQLTIQFEGATLGIAPELLQQLRDTITSEQLAGGKIQVKVTPKSIEEDVINDGPHTSLQGNAVELDISIVATDGTVHRISNLVKPVKLSLPIDATMNADLLGIYKIADNGSLIYLGGSRVANSMEVEVDTLGTYVLLEYTMNFEDVPESHWAANSIRILAAKHLIQGASEGQYQPNRTITRAEFIKIVANALNLKDKATLAFSDVAAGAWYEEDLAKMVKYGLVSGRTSDHFEPNANISRQEIVMILMRAYAMEHGNEPHDSSTEFSDEAQIASWAKDSVQRAVALGLVKGRIGNQFAPNDLATRAEAAQFILNYLK
ncbi:endo-beta-N-acetylglucosaminidase [Paenibacillus anaericanus]|uniref:endo-beta-N-acetylglucosaminidase n=1 Tax=Paenibacillus anaericanus TaxID=170367 RepID=UPI0027D8C3EB|nr:S-layer homology domain-containing protein [Paenibacillus anaericanus]